MKSQPKISSIPDWIKGIYCNFLLKLKNASLHKNINNFFYGVQYSIKKKNYQVS